MSERPPTNHQSTPKGVQHTVAGRLLGMRSDLLRLVTVLNTSGRYKDAADCQALVIAVDAFNEENDFDRCVWPPEADEDGGLKWTEDYGA